METPRAANARSPTIIDLLMLCPRGWIVLATLALVLWLPVALALALSRDFGAFNSSDSWTVLQAEVD